jgi:DNA mismatch repair ATPase MutS
MRGDYRASSRIHSFVGFATLLDYRRDPSVGLFLPILFWSTQIAFAAESWRSKYGNVLKDWMAVVGEFEALSALACYAFEHPENPFPTILEGGAGLDAKELRHPLIPQHEWVANSMSLGGELQLLIVSGSNMSGKSTLLRTIGINMVLALAGAPVCCKEFKCSPMQIGATLRVQDSLQKGISQFYAEIRRLKTIMNLAEEGVPVLFLFDEILHGTNSHDRAIGAEAVVRALVEYKAIGLVTTHDLALARVADALEPRAMNVHFEDHLENGEMIFDYRLHEGIIQKSNALELMRSIGLKV